MPNNTVVDSVKTPKVLPTGDPTTHDTDYVSIFQCTQLKFHDWIDISNLKGIGLEPVFTWFVSHVCLNG